MRWGRAAKIASLVLGGSAAILLLLAFLTQPESEDSSDKAREPPAEPLKAADDEEKKKGRNANLLLRKRIHHLLASAPPANEVAASIGAIVTEIQGGSTEEPELEAFGLVSADFTNLHSRGLVGCGGFAKVELVEHATSELRAWKMISKAQVQKAQMISEVLSERLILEATSLSNSPFIIGYYGCCQTKSCLLFQLEYGIGGELYSVYKRENLYGSEEHARYYMACACSAIDHLHSLHIVLRSLKPEDCVLTGDGRPKLVDFGLSKFIVNKTYTTCGTPDYFAPEIIAAAGHAFELDWWGVGVMTFELLSGSPPFEASTPMQIYTKVLKGIKTVTFPKSVTPSAKSLIHQLCAQVPDHRLPNGFRALEEQDFFRPLGPWPGLAKMSPPFKPRCDNGPLCNFSPNADDIPQFLRTKPPTPAMPEFELFGQEGPDDEFPPAG